MAESVAERRMRDLASEPLLRVGPRPGLLHGSLSSIRDIWARHELTSLLVKRELRARYKNSSLGFVWSMLKPLAQLLVYFFVIGELLGMGKGMADFGIYIFAGLTVWTFFNEMVAGGTGAIVANSGLVKKVYLPREVFPLSTVGAALVNFLIQLGILLAFTLIRGAFPAWAPIAYLPLGLLLILLFGTALALLMSAINVYMRDMQHLIEIAMMLLFWASPIIYPYSYVETYFTGGRAWLEELYLANPITLAVLAFQRGAWVRGAGQPFPSYLPLRLVIATIVSVAFLWLCQRVFARIEGNFAQEL
jgi:ABC-2 type transport system permease protein